eukprot:2252488-Rhodomonas_salina.1
MQGAWHIGFRHTAVWNQPAVPSVPACATAPTRRLCRVSLSEVCFALCGNVMCDSDAGCWGRREVLRVGAQGRASAPRGELRALGSRMRR